MGYLFVLVVGIALGVTCGRLYGAKENAWLRRELADARVKVDALKTHIDVLNERVEVKVKAVSAEIAEAIKKV